VGKAVHLRRTPELRFVWDESLERAAEIERVLDQLEIPPAPPEDSPMTTEADAEKDTDSDNA